MRSGSPPPKKKKKKGVCVWEGGRRRSGEPASEHNGFFLTCPGTGYDRCAYTETLNFVHSALGLSWTEDILVQAQVEAGMVQAASDKGSSDLSLLCSGLGWVALVWFGLAIIYLKSYGGGGETFDTSPLVMIMRTG